MKKIFIVVLLFSFCSNLKAQNPLDKMRLFATNHIFSNGLDKQEDDLSKINLGKHISPDLTPEILHQTAISYPKEYQKYCLMIVLKLYQFHLNCCHQGYNLNTMREEASARMIINEVYCIIGEKYYNEEFTSSARVYDWVIQNNQYLNDQEIKKLVQELGNQIKQIQKKIKN